MLTLMRDLKQSRKFKIRKKSTHLWLLPLRGEEAQFAATAGSVSKPRPTIYQAI